MSGLTPFPYRTKLMHMENNTKHLNTAQEIVAAWEDGQPLAALCGYERVVTEGQVPDGDLCLDCARTADQQGFLLPTKVLTPAETRSRAKGWYVTKVVARWSYEGDN